MIWVPGVSTNWLFDVHIQSWQPNYCKNIIPSACQPSEWTFLTKRWSRTDFIAWQWPNMRDFSILSNQTSSKFCHGTGPPVSPIPITDHEQQRFSQVTFSFKKSQNQSFARKPETRGSSRILYWSELCEEESLAQKCTISSSRVRLLTGASAGLKYNIDFRISWKKICCFRVSHQVHFVTRMQHFICWKLKVTQRTPRKHL